MEEFHGLTAETYQAIVAIIDDRLRDVRVTREGFDRLTQAISGLTDAQARTAEGVGHLETRMDRVETALGRLAEAQARTEERVGRLEEAVGRLAEAQARTEERVGRLEEAVGHLAEAQARTEARVDQLAQAQARTEVALQQLSRQVGGLSETVGGDIEDIAYIVLYDVLKREFGWEVGVLERTWQQWNGDIEEINIFGRATDTAQPQQTIWIVGEAKHNLTLREAERFAQQVERARQHLVGEVYAVCFAYRARPEVRTRLRDLGIPLLFSYGRFA
jgi:predicted nuclease with TOPRIM domain